MNNSPETPKPPFQISDILPLQDGRLRIELARVYVDESGTEVFETTYRYMEPRKRPETPAPTHA